MMQHVCLTGYVPHTACIPCMVQIGPINCQLVAEHCVRPTTCSVAFSPATFNFLRHRTFLKAGLKEGREMQLLVNRDSLLLQIYPGSRNYSSQGCQRCVCFCVCVRAWLCVCVCVSHGVNHCGGAIKAYQTPVELPSCGRLSPLPPSRVSLSGCDCRLLPTHALPLTLAGSRA